MQSPPVEPNKPNDDDCCGNGCVNCVWDVYERDFEKFKEEMGKYQKFRFVFTSPYLTRKYGKILFKYIK
jgi:Oxidoreductase-like protein, N-terminal